MDVAAFVVDDPPVVEAGVVTSGVTVVEAPPVVAVDSVEVIFAVDVTVVVVAVVLLLTSVTVEVAEAVGLFKPNQFNYFIIPPTPQSIYSRHKSRTKRVRHRHQQRISLALIYTNLILLVLLPRKTVRAEVSQNTLLVPLTFIRLLCETAFQRGPDLAAHRAEAVVELGTFDGAIAEGFDRGKTFLAGGVAEIAEDAVCCEG